MSLSRRIRRIAVAAVALAAIGGSALIAVPASAAPVPVPSSLTMAALGDSITEASMTCSILYVCPANSWSTGSSSAVVSHATRLRAAGAGVLAFNDAVPGAVAADLPGQARWAVAQRAQYVTVEIGANDGCADSVAEMTPTSSFSADVRSALATLAAGSAKPRIFVASIPNLTRLWALNKGNLRARLAWASFGFCDSMLANPTSTAPADVARRAAVQQRVDEYNAELASACAATANCRWDDGAVATQQFAASDISTIDYFHPSVAGQKLLAAITWAKTPWVS